MKATYPGNRFCVLLLALVLPVLASAPVRGAESVPTVTSSADCLFNWAETAYPTLFPAPATSSQWQAPYYYRFYPAATAYLGTTSNDPHLVYAGPMSNGSLLDVGALDTWLAKANCASSAPVLAAAGAFRGNIVLGSPGRSSVKANVYSPDQSGTLFIAYGTAPGVYDRQTAVSVISAGMPLEVGLDRLQADRRYYYRAYFQPTSGGGYSAGDEASFHTVRPAGSSFVFGVQGDSHPERTNIMFNATLYTRTLATAAADNPDFYVLMGDDFSVDQLTPETVDQAQVVGRYTLQRPWLSLIGRSAPLYLVNGNHEQAAGYLLDGTANNVAVWAQNARNSLYSQPAPDDFYTGNETPVAHIGLLRNYFAWTWGDALFVVIDPYWHSPVPVDAPFGGGRPGNRWQVTHGEAQYQWLKRTLEQSNAKYKFVFAHHVMGTQRGGAEVAKQYEWGDESRAFAINRPTWVSSIHRLLVDNRVSIFFQGHDHIWVRQQLDGVTYQTVSVPADPNYALLNSDAYLTGDKLPGSGYTRVSVSPVEVRVDYVRTYLPADESSARTSGSVAFSYNLSPR